MNIQGYEDHRDDLLEEATRIEGAKRPAYTLASSDVLHNFKHVAKRMGITPMQAWGVYFLKHVDAICAQAKNPNIPQAEELIGRYADAINYLKLGWALSQEESSFTVEKIEVGQEFTIHPGRDI